MEVDYIQQSCFHLWFIHLLVRDGYNYRQKYKEDFKPPKNNRIIFEKQAIGLSQVELFPRNHSV